MKFSTQAKYLQTRVKGINSQSRFVYKSCAPDLHALCTQITYAIRVHIRGEV